MQERGRGDAVIVGGSSEDTGTGKGGVYPLCLTLNVATSLAVTLHVNKPVSFQSRTFICIARLWLSSTTHCGHWENVRGMRMQPAQLPSVSVSWSQMSLVPSSRWFCFLFIYSKILFTEFLEDRNFNVWAVILNIPLFIISQFVSVVNGNVVILYSTFI